MVREIKCDECGSSFICEENTVTCWCASLPEPGNQMVHGISQAEINIDGDCMCKNCLLKKYREKILKTDEITNDLFEEEYRYQWKNRH